jgi:hypothetical protein
MDIVGASSVIVGAAEIVGYQAELKRHGARFFRRETPNRTEYVARLPRGDGGHVMVRHAIHTPVVVGGIGLRFRKAARKVAKAHVFAKLTGAARKLAPVLAPGLGTATVRAGSRLARRVREEEVSGKIGRKIKKGLKKIVNNKVVRSLGKAVLDAAEQIPGYGTAIKAGRGVAKSVAKNVSAAKAVARAAKAVAKTPASAKPKAQAATRAPRGKVVTTKSGRRYIVTPA